MKIRIELDVAPDEVPLATELLSVLRGFTDHVSVNKAPAPNAFQLGSLAAQLPSQPVHTPVPASTAYQALPGSAPSAALSPVALLHGAPSNGVAAPSPTPPIAAAAAPPQAGLPTQPTAAAAAAAPAAAHPVHFPPGTTTAQMFEQLLLAAEYSQDLENEARQLESIFLNSSLGQPLDLVQEFSAVWKRVALDASLLDQERSAYPFVALLPQFNRDLMSRVRDLIMEDLMKHLTLKRAINVDRAEFYVHAEAFAALASFEIIALEGAVTTMAGTMLKKPTSRSAAVTMLGKTVDLASQLILEKCSESTLTLMHTNVSNLEEEEFQYDKSFILECMGWTSTPEAPTAVAESQGSYAAPAAAAPGAAPYPANGVVQPQLHPVQSCQEHTEMIFGLAVDTLHRQVVSGGKDSFLQVWTEEGRAVQRLDLGDKYVSTLDFHPKLGMLLSTCVSSTNNYPIYIGGFSALEPLGFTPQGLIQRPTTSQISCVRALPDTSGFISSEAALGPQGQRSQDILFWDLGSGGGLPYLQPVSTFKGNTDIVTTMAKFPDDPYMFVSGAKDAFMYLWDLRTQHSVASFGEAQMDGGVRAHASMITCLESCGHLLFSGSADRTVKVWDLRRVSPNAPAPSLATLSVDNMVVLKVAANASRRLAAVSAMNGLYLLDFANEAAPTLRRAEFSWPEGRRQQAYHDIKWSEDKAMLFAGGKEAVLDMYALA